MLPPPAQVEVDCTDSTAKDNANDAMLKALESNGRPLSSELDTAKFNVSACILGRA